LFSYFSGFNNSSGLGSGNIDSIGFIGFNFANSSIVKHLNISEICAASSSAKFFKAVIGNSSNFFRFPNDSGSYFRSFFIKRDKICLISV